jgi:hypothetical protein
MINLFFQILLSLILIIPIDFLSILLYYKICKKKSVIPHNARWFFIHFVVNSVITILGYDDFAFCIKNIELCAVSKWSEKTEVAFALATSSHIYHMFFFMDKLKPSEWVHHISMCVVCVPLTIFYNSTKNAMVALWFLTGFPGAIDYFLLWLVKLEIISKELEKQLYILISLLLRSPGCIMSITLQIPLLWENTLTFTEKITKLLINMMVFWNGQYYLLTTIKDSVRSNII